MSAYLAPPVRYPVELSRKAAALAGWIWAAAAALNLAWWQLSAPGDPGPVLGGLSLLAVGLLLWVQHARPVRGEIIWDGNWQWCSQAYPAGTALLWPQVVFDGQQLMLVRLRNADGARWLLWLDVDARPQDWWDLRRALFARPAALDPEGETRAS